MVTLEIVKYAECIPKASQAGRKPRFRAYSDEHLQHIFSNHLNHVRKAQQFVEGATVRIRNLKGKPKGTIINIEEDFKRIEWTDLKCRFIEVYQHNTDELCMYHPSDLIVT